MKLVNAARYFDKEQVFDAYSGAYLFSAQMLSPSERSSTNAFKQHTMSTAAGCTPPARGAVLCLGDVWLMGNNNPDGFKGRVIRRGHALRKSTGSVSLLTPGQACLAAAGTAIYAYKEFSHTTIDTLSNSEYDTLWSVYCDMNEAVVKGSFLRDGAGLMRVKNCYDIVDGFNVAQSDQFDTDAVQTAVFQPTGPKDLVTGVPTGAGFTTTALQTDVLKFYEFRTQGEGGQKAGDRSVFIAKSAGTPAPGATFTMMGRVWRVVEAVSELDAWALLARLV